MARRKKKPENVCKFVEQSRAREAADQRDGHKRGLWYDKDAADVAVQFISKLTHWDGEFADKPFILEPWQEFDIVRPLFGWKILPKGMTAKEAVNAGGHHSKPGHRVQMRTKAGIFRRFRTAYIEIPRKNGKTTLGAAIMMVLLYADGEQGAQVYSAATTREQARIAFDMGLNMVDASSELRGVSECLRTALIYPRIKASFKPVSSEAGGLQGKGPHGVLIDEYHEHKTPRVYDVLRTGQGSRRQPLCLIITTAGEGVRTPCHDERLFTEKVISGALKEDSRFGYIVCADPEDDWRLPATWKKANPNYGVSVKPSFFEKELERAKGSPSARAAFLRYYLNIWVSAEHAWLEYEKWDVCGKDYGPEYLKGRTCYAGVDLSRTIDLTAMVLVFAPVESDPLWRILPFFWVPEDSIVERGRRDKVPYQMWADDGFLTATPGAVVDYNFLTEKLRWASKEFDLKEVGYDPYNATKWYTDLEQERFVRTVEVRQGPITLNAPMKYVEGLIFSREIAHPNNPVMNWCVSNCVGKEDSNGNICPDKAKSVERIDGVSAMMTSMTRAMCGRGTIYAEREMIVL